MPINTLEFCEGSEYTNVPYSGSKETLIDYMCIQTSAVGDVLSCAFLDDSAINVSTHRPITCSIRFSFKPISQPPNQTPYINWRNVKQQSIDKYRRFIENDVNIKQIPQSNISSDADIDRIYNSIVDTINLATKKLYTSLQIQTSYKTLLEMKSLPAAFMK